MADPLSLLRDFVSNGKVDDVVLTGDRVDFGGKFSFDKSVPTGYKSQQGKGRFYDLETLLFFAKNIDLKFGEYFKKAAKDKAVTFVDRKDLHDYLTGQTDRSDHIQLAVADFEVQPPSKKARVEEAEAGPEVLAAEEDEATEEAALRKIRENELQLRDRNSMLSVPGRKFNKVLSILNHAQQKLQSREKEAARKQAARPVIPIKPSGRYERQTQQDATLKQLGAAQLGVQVGFKPTTAAAAAAAANGSSAAASQQGAAPPPPPPDMAAPRPAAQHSQRHSSHHSQHRRAAAQQQKRPQRRGTPIIMVPPGLTALLNMYNIRPFLEEGRFRTTDEAKTDAVQSGDNDVEKKEWATIQRTIGRKAPVKYYVTDKEPSKQDWERVVAVVCLGKTWQFKRWPFKGAATGDLVETFSRVLGVYVHYLDEAVDATVKSWNVKVLGINRQSRHRDATVSQEFWRLLDAHLSARGSTLAY